MTLIYVVEVSVLSNSKYIKIRTLDMKIEIEVKTYLIREPLI